MSHKSLDTPRRWPHALLLAAMLGGSTVLAIMRPDPAGFGTHRSLGLPPCVFFSLTGIRCPSCGLTTSLVHFIHGNWSAALRANPFGLVVSGTVIWLVIASLYGLFRPFRWGQVVTRSWFHMIVMCAIALLFGSWIVRILY